MQSCKSLSMWSLVAIAVSSVVLVADSSPLLAWKPCPPGQAGVDCATLQAPLDPDGNHPGTVDVFIRRLYHSATGPTHRAVFLIDGGPGYSANALASPALYLLEKAWDITVYLIDQRGTGLSSPLNCQDPPTQQFAPEKPPIVRSYRACMQNVINTSKNILPFFSTYHGAKDYVLAVNAINPETVSIYALSYGTYFTNTYLQLPGARADAVVMDGPVPCNRWALENNAEWVSRVSMSILRLCGQISPLCANRTGLMGQIPRLVMDAVLDGTLPCLKKLPWLNQRVAATYSSFMTLNQTAHALIAPFWYRLYRCSDSDAAQLNVFHGQMRAQRTRRQDANSTVFSEYSVGLAVNIGASELYSYGNRALALNYSQQMLLTSRVFADATPELVTSFAREFWPMYTPNSQTYMTFARPTIPVMVTVGTLDPNTPHGNGPWLVNGLGKTARLITVPFAAHGTFSLEATCADGIISNFLLSTGTEINTTCLQDIQPPDFDGSQKSTKRLANAFFGTNNLWNLNSTLIAQLASSIHLPSTQHGGATDGYVVTTVQLAGVVIGSSFVGGLATTLVAALMYKYHNKYGTDDETYSLTMHSTLQKR